MALWVKTRQNVVINSTVLIILLLVSPLAMFILHKKHTYCSMRRNSVISSFLETSESRLGHMKEINKNNRTGTHKVTHHIGVLHSCTLVIILKLILGWLLSTTVTATSQEHLSTNVAWRKSSKEPTMFYITTAYSTFGKTKKA